ncbi:hypothetical protein GW17_00042547, partial [Ensete ventricosum]
KENTRKHKKHSLKYDAMLQILDFASFTVKQGTATTRSPALHRCGLHPRSADDGSVPQERRPWHPRSVGRSVFQESRFQAVGPPRWRLPPRSLRTAPKERREISLPRKPISGHRTSQAATAPWICADCTQGAYVDVGDSQMCIPYVSDIYGYLRSREVSLPRHRLLKSCRFSIYNSSFFLVSGEAEATGELLTWRQFRWESQPHDEEVPGGLDGPPGWWNASVCAQISFALLSLTC